MNTKISQFENNGNAATPRPHVNETEYDARADWAECSLAGDIYYRAISAWMASRQTVGNVYDIYMTGVRYEAALDRFLAQSLSSPITVESRLNCEGARLYKSLIAKEIDYLAGKLNTASESEPALEVIEPWTPVVPKPSVRPAQIVADVTAAFREKMAA